MADLRWDQGRGDYFSLEALKGFCEAVSFVQTTRQPDLRSFKAALSDHLRRGPGITVGGRRLPFPPASYDVWRNYGRIYQSVYLVYGATTQIELTPLGSLLTTLDIASAEDRALFYSILASRLRWPNPTFKDYSPALAPSYLVQIAIKILIGTDNAPLDIERLAKFSWACCNPAGGIPISGAESPARISSAFLAYAGSPAVPKDRLRQFREMIGFFTGPVFEESRGGITLVAPLASNVGATLSSYCDPSSYRPSPVADPDAEIRLRGSLVSGAAPTGGAVAPPPRVTIATRPVAPPTPARSGRRGGAPRAPRSAPRTSYYTLSNERQIEAERLVHEHLVATCGPASIIWFAKTALEFAPHDSLDTPGADGQVLAAAAGVPAGYHEVKSREGSSSSFTLTRNEIRRILDCARRGVGYHLWEVSFDAAGAPTLRLIPDIQNEFAPGTPRHDAARYLFDTDSRARSGQFQF